jgi:polygalacturonase
VKVTDGKTNYDHTHLTGDGKNLFAKLVVEELGRAVPDVFPLFRTEPVARLTPQVYPVRDFGARGDGHTLDTAAIQRAIDVCGQAGGGVVQLTKGIYLSQPLTLRSAVTLQVDEGATLQATDNPTDFADPDAPNRVRPFIGGSVLAGVTISGKGVIDGAGEKWWQPVREAKRTKQPEPKTRRPRLIVINQCNGLTIRDVTLQNSPSFHLVPVDCEDVLIDSVTIRAPADAPNTDAIDPSATRYLIITNCVLDVGDDNIAIKSGHHDEIHPNAACENIEVVNCTFLHGHGMSIGSETVGGVKNLTVRRCTFNGTTSGIRIKSDRTRGGTVEQCEYTDLQMTNVKIPIHLTAYYPRIPTNDTAQPMTALTPIYRDITIRNVTANSPQSAGFLVGLPECAVSNVVFANVTITAPKGLTVRHARGIKFTNSRIEAGANAPLILQDGAEVTGLNAPVK